MCGTLLPFSIHAEASVNKQKLQRDVSAAVKSSLLEQLQARKIEGDADGKVLARRVESYVSRWSAIVSLIPSEDIEDEVVL